jgi:hypothetical protein
MDSRFRGNDLSEVILERATLLPASGAVSAFLTALTSSLAYHHSRVSLGVFGTALALLLPYSVN